MKPTDTWTKDEQQLLKLSPELSAKIYKEDNFFYLETSSKPFRISFLNGDFIFRLKTSSKKQPLLKALQIDKNKKVLDGTAGLGRDAILLAYYGAQVVACERHPLLYVMLEKAKEELFRDPLSQNIKGCIDFLYTDIFEHLKNTDYTYDALYLDPMYPDEDKYSKSKKDISILKELAHETTQLEDIIALGLKKVQSRVVLKRPPKAPHIGNPVHSIEAKMVRFDIYIPKSIK